MEQQKKSQAEKSLVLLVFLILFLNIFATIFMLMKVDHQVERLTADASGATVSFCINHPPTLFNPCSANLSQDETYSCQINGTDLDVGQNITFSLQWPGVALFTINSSTGVINFIPDDNAVGDNHSVLIIADDGSGCSNGVVNETFNFSVGNLNDPPVWLTVPDAEIIVNVTYQAYSLNDYVVDPDGDVLTFNGTIPGAPFTMTVSSGGSVTIFANACEPEEQYVSFFVSDGNYSVQSNLVKLTISCPEDQSGGGDSAGGGASSGGSGGGVSSLCRSEWECLDWMQCIPTGFQWQHCYDLQGCEEPKFLKRECEYVGPLPVCEENWLCDDWGPCNANLSQYRECRDLNECGTALYVPHTNQLCSFAPSCSDGVLNGDETGVDCGGSCPVCPLIETPEFISPAVFNMWLLLALILGVLLVSGIGRLYHEELRKALARIAFFLSRRRVKEFLLSNEEKNLLLEKTLHAELLIEKNVDWVAEKKYGLIAFVARQLLSILGRLPEEFTREELVLGLQKRKLSKEAFALVLSFFDKVFLVEASKLDYDKAFLYALSEELRLIICAFSDYSVADVERELVEFRVSENISFLEEILVRFINIYRALQFEQFDFAKKEYAAVLAAYEDLPKQDQEPMYDEVAHLFTAMKYLMEHADVS